MEKINPTFAEFPVIRTSRLTLREITLEDQADIFNIFSDPEVTKYYDVETMRNIKPAVALIKYWQRRIKTGKAMRWGVSLSGSSKLIGTGGFSELDSQNQSGEIGCDLVKAYWGKGIMTEALKAVVKFGFESMKLHRIETWIMVENSASIHMIEKLGFQKEGFLRERQYWMGKYNDVEMFGLLRRDWESMNS